VADFFLMALTYVPPKQGKCYVTSSKASVRGPVSTTPVAG
jgi:hypothetical protein